MTDNIFLLLARDIVFYGYVITAFAVLGFQSSISQTAYPLRERGKYWIFCAVTLTYSTLGFIAYPSMVTGIMAAGLYFAAAAPYFRDNATDTITHYFGANLSMAGGFWLIYADFGFHTLAFTMAITLLLLEYIPGFISGCMVRNKTTWIELIIYTYISAGYYLYFVLN